MALKWAVGLLRMGVSSYLKAVHTTLLFKTCKMGGIHNSLSQVSSLSFRTSYRQNENEGRRIPQVTKEDAVHPHESHAWTTFSHSLPHSA